MLSNAIIIPYRDRRKHLEYFIDNTVPLIQKHLPHTKVIVVEQANDKLFNRGKLLNVGFMEYKDKTKYFFTHDVDINPNIDVIKTVYSNNDIDIYRIKSGHTTSLGGIIKVKHDIIFDVNGFPNDIWGWGIEDRVLYYRCIMKQYKITDNKKQLFKIMPHPSNVIKYVNEKKKLSDMWRQNYIDTLNEKQKEEMIMGSGLNNLDYTILERKTVHDMVELIKVDI
jgi:hypothetical protein